MKPNLSDCYCGSRKPYQNCCQPYLSGTSIPKTPEQLMRSRYAAFCTADIEYLMKTRHPTTRGPKDRDVLKKTVDTTRWLGLKVVKAQDDKATKAVGYVEFAAFYEQGDIGQIHERSRFIHEDGQWYYLDGELLSPLTFGRNEPCWCGSKKKIKKCHGK